MLCDIGHVLESFYFHWKHTPTVFNRQKDQNNQNYKNKLVQSQYYKNTKKTGKKRKRGENIEWKNKDIKLVGIPTDIFEERKKTDFCL